MIAEDLGLERTVRAEWRDLFERRGPGNPRIPSFTVSVYPPGGELLAELSRQHARLEERWRTSSPQELGRPLEWRFGGHFTALRSAALFLAVPHEALHLGSLAAWRRHLGLPSALGRMPRG